MNILIIKGIVFILGNSNRGLGIGDWGLGQSPIPNPQSPKSKVII